ncbi:MAG TPA: tRNA preQ1(34) S-adenosylmethionine ribosyltransferase-isomerase QueA [Thermomicrobiales bacterium]|nr:tRNA preQ1(34) S-adenosylmethionine ribosyltransferase-isomerase QueA [Thermomicrobiales bacterium]
MTQDQHDRTANATRHAMADFDYHLPPELIAQEPLADREASRLLVLPRDGRPIEHRVFRDLPDLLDPGDLLVVNDSRVIPARLLGHRETGAEVEILLLRREESGLWRALARPTRRLRIDERIVIPARTADGDEASAILREKLDDGQVLVELDDSLTTDLDHFGRVPLPPYITHHLDDDERYQTVYSAQKGSAAAPTAGLHFTQEIFRRLEARGVGRTSVTLHVGLDTFRPVNEDFAEDHVIHQEWCSVPPEAWEAIAAAKEHGSRVVAVGTTAARTLETLGQRVKAGNPGPFSDMTGIYITPGYEWQMVDALVTNFHLPKSTLLLMISAFAGRDRVLAAYEAAIAERYRFFSFGDAMLML